MFVAPSRPAHYLLADSSNYPISKYVSYQDLSASYQSYLSQVDSVSIPRSAHEALQDPQWVAAMKAEMDALQDNQTWELVALPAGERYKGV